jgi:hypothetical protein
MIMLLAPLLLFGLYLGLIASLAPRRGGLTLWATATAIAATVRVGVLWSLLTLHWRQTLGLWATPVLLLLLPEGLLLRREFMWTFGRAVLVTGLLIVGTALWTAVAFGVFRLFCRRTP